MRHLIFCSCFSYLDIALQCYGGKQIKVVNIGWFIQIFPCNLGFLSPVDEHISLCFPIFWKKTAHPSICFQQSVKGDCYMGWSEGTLVCTNGNLMLSLVCFTQNVTNLPGDFFEKQTEQPPSLNVNLSQIEGEGAVFHPRSASFKRSHSVFFNI